MIQSVNTAIATPGPGYLATSATSATVANTGTITLTTQSGLAYTAGARVRASYTSDPTKWMEGIVTSYAGTTLAFTADTAAGSGTFASWSINLAGQPGAATAVAVGTTTTGAAGTSASVTNSGTAYAPTLNFTIPKGDKGDQGVGYTPRGVWASGTTYAQGDMVSYSSVNYYSLAGSNTNHQPDISATWWQSAAASGLGDPGANGVITRTATNATAPATADNLASPIYAVDSGAANAIAATLSPAISGYTAGSRYRVKAANANTGATTVNLNSLGAVTIKKWSAGSLVDLAAGDISAGQMLELTYDGVYMQMQAANAIGAPAWNALPTLQNSWVGGNTGIYGTPAYAVDGLGLYCHIRGQLGSGTQVDGTLLWTFASAQRPQKDVWKSFPVQNAAGAVVGMGHVRIGTDGTVKVYGISGYSGPYLDIMIQFPLF